MGKGQNSAKMSVALLILLPVGLAFAEGQGGGVNRPNRGGMGQLPTVEKIEERLEKKLTDEQKTKITALHDEITKKLAELDAKDDVKAAREALKNAKDDAEARKAAQAKLKEAMGGFNAFEDYKKGLGAILSADEVAKVFPQGGGRRREGMAGDKKTGEEPKKTEEAKKPEEAPEGMK